MQTGTGEKLHRIWCKMTIYRYGEARWHLNSSTKTNEYTADFQPKPAPDCTNAIVCRSGFFYSRQQDKNGWKMNTLNYTYIEPLYPSQYLGKRFNYRDGNLKKEGHQVGSFTANVFECTDLRAFYEDIHVISQRKNCAIILGAPTEIAIGEPFQIRSVKWFTEKLGKQGRKDMLGVHEVGGTKVIGRFKENFEPSRLVLIDYDPNKHTPHDHIHETDHEYLDALWTLMEDFAFTGFVVTSSSSAGLVSPEGDYLSGKDKPNRHVFFVVDDPSDIPRFRQALIYQSLKNDAWWQYRDKGNSLQTRYIFDANTFSPERIVYEGEPQLNDGITQDREPPRYFAGGSLDTSKLVSPTPEEIVELHHEKGIGPRLTEDRATGETRYTYSLSDGGERRPKLTKKIKFVRSDDRYTVMTVQNFLDSGDREWRIISEFRCGLDEAPSKPSVSEVLLRSRNGDSCILYEHDGQITYCFPQHHKFRGLFGKRMKKRSRKPDPEQLVPMDEDFFETDVPVYAPKKLKLTDIDLHRGSLHLIFGRPGQGKSRIATQLAQDGRCVIFASASNEQAEEQFNNWSYPHKELVLSRPYRLKRDHGLDVVLFPPDDPFEAPEPDETATFDRMVDQGVAKDLKHAQEIWKALGTAEQGPPLQEGTIIFTTFERARIWGRAGYLKPKANSDPVRTKCIRRTVLFVDDVDRESISDYRYIDSDVQAWINREHAKTNRRFETVTTSRGNGYLVRPRYKLLLQGYERLPVLFTTVEWRARMVLERLYPDKLRVHDLSPDDNAKDYRTDLYLFGTTLVRAKYHALFHLLREVWRRLGIDWLWVGDGVCAQENHYTIRGKNRYREEDTIVKVSQPHLDATDKAMLDLWLEDGNQNVAAAFAMLDQLNQGAGRNQGERFNGKRCVAFVDPQYLKILDEYCGYHCRVVSQIKDVALSEIEDADVRCIVRSLKRPVTACKEALTEGVSAWLRSPDGVLYKPDVEQAMREYDAVTAAERANMTEKMTALTGGMLQDALEGTSWRDIEKRRNLGRKLQPQVRQYLKQVLKATRLALEGKRDIGARYASLRAFEQRRNLSRAITEPDLRSGVREVLRGKQVR